MNQVTKAQAEALIERLGNKTTTCPSCGKDLTEFDPCIPCPTMLTDVLEKLQDHYRFYTFINDDGDEVYGFLEELCGKWQPCSFTKSLQDILAEAEWRVDLLLYPAVVGGNTGPASIEVMKGPAADLFSYLITL